MVEQAESLVVDQTTAFFFLVSDLGGAFKTAQCIFCYNWIAAALE
jgi:hypothetical protein